jgi:hypothetical protein
LNLKFWGELWILNYIFGNNIYTILFVEI